MANKAATKLTGRRSKFVDGLIEGKTQAQAYVDAGYKHNPSNATALWKDPRIQAEFNKRRGVVEQQANWSRESAIDLLWDIAQNSAARDGDRIKAVAEMAKFCGWYRPHEVDVKSDGRAVQTAAVLVVPDDGAMG
ncbi:MAG: terminase small subunit [Myxococcota bacterium]